MAKNTPTWPDLAIELYDKLTGRKAETTYDFDDLEVYVPAHHADNAELARWKLNGVLKIRTREVKQT